MPAYMIDFTIGLAIPRKQGLVDRIYSKLTEKGHPPLEIKEKGDSTGIVYWVFKTDKTIPHKTRDETIKEIMDELPADKKIIDPRISIKPV